MPSSSLTFDLATRGWLDGTGTVLTSITAKRGDMVRYVIGVAENGDSIDLDDSAVLTVAIKDPANPAGSYLAQATGSKTGRAIFARWKFDLNFTDESIDTFLGSSTIAKATNFELQIATDTQRISSPFLTLNLEPDIIRDDSTITITPETLYVYRPDIHSLAALCSTVATLGLVTGSIYRIVDTTGSSRVEKSYELQAGLYDSGDPQQGNPFDYDGTTNNRHWGEVG